MGEVIGDLLPVGIAIAVSPMQIIVVILMLLSPRAATISIGFLVGWIAGIVVVTVLVVLLVGQAGDSSGGEPSTLSSVLTLLFGALLLVMAGTQWQGRPEEGEVAASPKWMSAIESFTLGKAVRLGVLMSGVNPKNLLLCLSAGTTIGAAHLSGPQNVIVVVVFTVIAASTVGGPVIAYLVASESMGAPLRNLRTWLTQNNTTLMAVLLLVVGVALIGKGIGGLTS